MPQNNGNLRSQEHWIQDGSGNVLAVPTQEFEYDSLNRLLRTRQGSTWQQEYSYDRYGNRSINAGATWGGVNSTQSSVVPNTTTNRVYAPNETEQSHPLMDYDAAGNQTKGPLQRSEQHRL